MSGHIGGQTRALPFTGFATGPLALIGLVLSAAGWTMTKFRTKKTDA
ncbi:MAG TPA: hypothetical protein VKA21_11345 [Candidatus Binatia bacterium]|nr:hypothetical protein [Candidatus Binatia bacterium]